MKVKAAAEVDCAQGAVRERQLRHGSGDSRVHELRPQHVRGVFISEWSPPRGRVS